MKKRGSFWKDFKTAIPRLILAILIAIVIAKPLELKIFESEIQAELVKIEQENYKEQDDLVRLRYSNDIVAYKSDIASLKDEIKTKQLERDLLVNEAIAEADGTGGSQRKNLGPIYKTKKAAADKVQTELDNILTTNNALIVSKQSKIAQLNSDQSTAITALERSSMSGFAARIEGLERAANRSQAIWIANLFIMLLFIAVETAPVFSKLILQRGPYDFVLSKHEQLFEVDHKAFTSQQVNTTDSEIRFNNEMLDYKTKLAIIAEKELADDAIRRRIEELKGKTRLTPSFITKSSLLQ